MENNDTSANNYFSIDSGLMLCVSQSTTTTVTNPDGTREVTDSVSEVKIPYRSMVQPYGVPFRFLMTLYLTSGYNAEYAQKVADLIEDGEIVLTVFESNTTTTSEYTYTYDVMRKWQEEVEVEVEGPAPSGNTGTAGVSNAFTNITNNNGNSNNRSSNNTNQNRRRQTVSSRGAIGGAIGGGSLGDIISGMIQGTQENNNGGTQQNRNEVTQGGSTQQGGTAGVTGDIGDIMEENPIEEEQEEPETHTEIRTEIKTEQVNEEPITETTTTVTETNTITANVTKVDLWVIEREVDYNTSSNTEHPLEEEGITNTLPNEDEPELQAPDYEEVQWHVNRSENTVETVETTTWEQGTSTSEIDRDGRFLGLLKNSTGTDSGNADYDPNGKEVEYQLPEGNTKEAPIETLETSQELLYKTLEDSESTQNHATIMRELLNYYFTGEVGEIDFSIFNANEFTNVSYVSSGPGNVHNTRYTLEEFINIVETYQVPSGTGATGISNADGYRRNFIEYAEDFYNIATSYGLNPEFIFAIGIHESGFGTSRILRDKHNAFGYGAVDGSAYESAWTFPSMKEGIEQECRDLANNFLNPNSWKYQSIVEHGYDPNSIDGIGSLYASDGSWSRKVKLHMQRIFGYLDDGISATGEANAVIELAKSKQGCPYVWGASGPSTFDCSGFVQWIFRNAVNINLPRTSSEQARSLAGNEVTFSQARPGDIVWRSGHIGIYIGNDQYIHAPQTGDVVKISNNASSRFTKVFRVLQTSQ